MMWRLLCSTRQDIGCPFMPWRGALPRSNLHRTRRETVAVWIRTGTAPAGAGQETRPTEDGDGGMNSARICAEDIGDRGLELPITDRDLHGTLVFHPSPACELPKRSADLVQARRSLLLPLLGSMYDHHSTVGGIQVPGILTQHGGANGLSIAKPQEAQQGESHSRFRLIHADRSGWPDTG